MAIYYLPNHCSSFSLWSRAVYFTMLILKELKMALRKAFFSLTRFLEPKSLEQFIFLNNLFTWRESINALYLSVLWIYAFLKKSTHHMACWFSFLSFPPKHQRRRALWGSMVSFNGAFKVDMLMPSLSVLCLPNRDGFLAVNLGWVIWITAIHLKSQSCSRMTQTRTNLKCVQVIEWEYEYMLWAGRVKMAKEWK